MLLVAPSLCFILSLNHVHLQMQMLVIRNKFQQADKTTKKKNPQKSEKKYFGNWRGERGTCNNYVSFMSFCLCADDVIWNYWICFVVKSNLQLKM